MLEFYFFSQVAVSLGFTQGLFSFLFGTVWFPEKSRGWNVTNTSSDPRFPTYQQWASQWCSHSINCLIHTNGLYNKLQKFSGNATIKHTKSLLDYSTTITCQEYIPFSTSLKLSCKSSSRTEKKHLYLGSCAVTAKEQIRKSKWWKVNICSRVNKSPIPRTEFGRTHTYRFISSSVSMELKSTMSRILDIFRDFSCCHLFVWWGLQKHLSVAILDCIYISQTFFF